MIETCRRAGALCPVQTCTGSRRRWVWLRSYSGYDWDLSSGCSTVSSSNLYWKPEQPPLSTRTRRKLSGSNATRRICCWHMHAHDTDCSTGDLDANSNWKFNGTTATHAHTFNGPLSGTTRVSQYQKSKTNLDFTEARDSEWQWHQLGHMQVCTSLQTTTPAPHHSVFLQSGCPSCRPTNSVKALRAITELQQNKKIPHILLCMLTECGKFRYDTWY